MCVVCGGGGGGGGVCVRGILSYPGKYIIVNMSHEDKDHIISAQVIIEI